MVPQNGEILTTEMIEKMHKTVEGWDILQSPSPNLMKIHFGIKIYLAGLDFGTITHCPSHV